MTPWSTVCLAAYIASQLIPTKENPNACLSTLLPPATFGWRPTISARAEPGTMLQPRLRPASSGAHRLHESNRCRVRQPPNHSTVLSCCWVFLGRAPLPTPWWTKDLSTDRRPPSDRGPCPASGFALASTSSLCYHRCRLPSRRLAEVLKLPRRVATSW